MKLSALIACDVFAAELQFLGLTVSDYVAVPMGLHDDPARLQSEVQSAVDRLDSPGAAPVGIALGRCGGALLGVRARQTSLIVPRVDDCISLFLGGGQQAIDWRLRHPDHYFASPGWARGALLPGDARRQRLEPLFLEKYPDDPEMVEDLLEADRDTFAHYRTLTCLDTGTPDNEQDRARCQACAESMGWPMQSVPASLELLKKLIHGPWDNQHFLRVQPGQSIAADDHGHARVLKAVPAASS